MLLALSLTHATAGFDVLESATAAVAGYATEDLLRTALSPTGAVGAVVIATCNRVEAYLDLPAQAADAVTAHLTAELAARTGRPIPASAVVAHRETAALQHLFAVTAGLDSLVRGEGEIAGQVTRAYDAARRLGATTGPLDGAFQRAIATSRLIRGVQRQEGRRETSVVHAALDLAGARLDLSTARVLLVGTGAHARTAVRALASAGAGRVTVYSATGRAEQFAARHGIHAHPAGASLGAAIADSDLVLTCTRRTAVGHRELVGRSGSLLLVDLGLPRNVDPAVRDLPGVELLDLAALAQHLQRSGLGRDPHASAAVERAVAELAAQRQAAPAVVALRGHVEAVLAREITRARRRAGGGPEAERTEAALRHFAGVLLHSPTVHLHEAAADGDAARIADALRVLGVDLPPAPDAGS